jgi:hypothetical protein
MTKEEIKMEKNRLSAKRSREKQKKKFEELEEITANLKKENVRLNKNNQQLTKTILSFQKYVSKNACNSCFKNIPKELEEYFKNKEEEINASDFMISTSSSKSSMNSFAKLSIFAGILIVVCLVGGLFSQKISNEVSNKRNLSEISQYSTFSDPDYVNNMKNIDKIREINTALSARLLEEEKRPLFKTYKDYSNTIDSVGVETYKEILR